MTPWDSELNPLLLVCHWVPSKQWRTELKPPGLQAVVLLGEAKMLMSLLVWDNRFSIQGHWIQLEVWSLDFLTPSQILL